MVNYTPRTWVAGEVVTAAELNTEVRDPLIGIQAAAVAWSPTVGNVTLGNGTLTSNWNRVGKWVDFEIQLTFGSTSSLSASPTFTLPTTARTLGWYANATIFDSSVGALGYYPAAAVALGATALTCRIWNTTAGSPFAAITATTPMTWATGDVLTIWGRYEAA